MVLKYWDSSPPRGVSVFDSGPQLFAQFLIEVWYILPRGVLIIGDKIADQEEVFGQWKTFG